MRKTLLNDVSFLIPLRIDSVDRIENLSIVVDFILQNFDSEIHVLEASKFNYGILKKILPSKTQISFVEDFDTIFHIGHYRNLMISHTNKKICVFLDADIIVPIKQLKKSIELLRKNRASLVLPYDDFCYDVPEIIKEHYYETKDINTLIQNTGKMKQLYEPKPVGGCFLVNREIYCKAGLDNENFYGWGVEDGERIHRLNLLGYKVHRISGSIFHLTHSRGINSFFHDHKQKIIKITELNRIAAMSKKEIENEVHKWKYGN